MAIHPPVLERVYDVHGIAVNVVSDDRDVHEAMDLRLRDFPPAPHHAGELNLVFATGDGDARRREGGRTVYETRHGSLGYLPESDLLVGRFGDVSLTCDALRGVALIGSTRFSGRDLYLATHPLATISLIELLERRRLFSLHAACLVCAEQRGVLLAGPSGSGKSTLALALAHAGMSFLSDDTVFLNRRRDDRVEILGFADALGVTEYAADRFGDLRFLLEAPPADGFPKRLHRIETLFGTSAVQACEPFVIVFPEITSRRSSTLTPLDRGEAMLRLVPDVLLTEPQATQAHLAAIAELLRGLRCYTLYAGADLEHSAELIQAVV